MIATREELINLLTERMMQMAEKYMTIEEFVDKYRAEYPQSDQRAEVTDEEILKEVNRVYPIIPLNGKNDKLNEAYIRGARMMRFKLTGK